MLMNRKGIKPAWEDIKNDDGGKWSLSFPRSKIDEEWQNMVIFIHLIIIINYFINTNINVL